MRDIKYRVEIATRCVNCDKPLKFAESLYCNPACQAAYASRTGPSIVGNGDEDEPDDGKALGIAAVLVICIVAIVVIVGVAVGCRFIAKEMGW